MKTLYSLLKLYNNLIYQNYLRVVNSRRNLYAVVLFIAMFYGYLLLTHQPIINPEQLGYDPYEILGVERNATDQQIKKAFRGLSRKYHPDKQQDVNGKDNVYWQDRFTQILDAKAILLDEEKRKNYDEWQHPEGQAYYDDEYPAWVIRPGLRLIVGYILAGLFILLFPTFSFLCTPAIHSPPEFVGNYFFDQIEKAEADLESKYLPTKKFNEGQKCFELLWGSWENICQDFPEYRKDDLCSILQFRILARIIQCSLFSEQDNDILSSLDRLNDYRKENKEILKKKEIQQHIKIQVNDLFDTLQLIKIKRTTQESAKQCFGSILRR